MSRKDPSPFPQASPPKGRVPPGIHTQAITLGTRGTEGQGFRVALLSALYRTPHRPDWLAAPLRRGELWVRGVEFWNEM